jgi:hypothetical protein
MNSAKGNGVGVSVAGGAQERRKVESIKEVISNLALSLVEGW